MPKRIIYDPQFRARIVELAKGGRSLRSLQKEFGCHEASIRNWIRQTELDEGTRSDGLTSTEKDELSRLRRENERLREERDILKKAAAWFAQEATVGPKRRTDS